MNKYLFSIFGVTSLIFIVFLVSMLYAARNNNPEAIACVPNSGEFFKPHLKKIDSTTYEAFVVAKMWSFEPKEIIIPVNCDLDIFLTSEDIVHGLDIENKEFNMMAMPGAVMKKTVHFDKPGIYKIACHVFCGAPHQYMQSEIIVIDKIKL